MMQSSLSFYNSLQNVMLAVFVGVFITSIVLTLYLWILFYSHLKQLMYETK